MRSSDHVYSIDCSYFELPVTNKRDETFSTCPSEETTLQRVYGQFGKDYTAKIRANVGEMNDVSCVQVLQSKKAGA